jgi:hypothetical protein
LRPEDEEFILRTTREIVDGLAAPDPTDLAGRVVVLGVPAADGTDEMALLMLSHLTRAVGCEVVTAAGPGVAAPAEQAVPAAVVVAAVGPGGLTEARYLCRRLQSRHPGVKIVVGWWGRGKDPEKARARLLSAGADQVAATLREARTHLARLVHPLRPTPDADPQLV